MLMQAMPFAHYTWRDGILNLASYFPRECRPPDLGPKMYNAYGQRAAWQGMDPTTNKGGHTNLHCDVSDAVNVLVDAQQSEMAGDDSDDEADTEALVDEELGELRHFCGAIWDIYRSRSIA